MRVSAGKSAKQVKFLKNIYDQDFFQGILYTIWKEMSYWDRESDKETFSFFDYYIFSKSIFCKIKLHKTPLNVTLGLEHKKENQVGKVTNAGQLKSDISWNHEIVAGRRIWREGLVT